METLQAGSDGTINIDALEELFDALCFKKHPNQWQVSRGYLWNVNNSSERSSPILHPGLVQSCKHKGEETHPFHLSHARLFRLRSSFMGSGRHRGDPKSRGLRILQTNPWTHLRPRERRAWQRNHNSRARFTLSSRPSKPPKRVFNTRTPSKWRNAKLPRSLSDIYVFDVNNLDTTTFDSLNTPKSQPLERSSITSSPPTRQTEPTSFTSPTQKSPTSSTQLPCPDYPPLDSDSALVGRSPSFPGFYGFPINSSNSNAIIYSAKPSWFPAAQNYI